MASCAAAFMNLSVLFILLSAMLLLLFAIPITYLVTLGPHFKYTVIIACTSAPTLVGLAIILIGKRSRNKPEHTEEEKRGTPRKWPFTRRQTVIMAIVAVPLFVGLYQGLSVAVREFEEDGNTEKAAVALKRFSVISHLGGGEKFDREAVKQTLAELEDSYHRLKGEWRLPRETIKIEVWLFRDIPHYQAWTGLEYAKGHVWCMPDSGPVVAVPLEKAPSGSSSDNFTRTPTHEMVHALMCQSLEAEAFHSIPPWFHEGMATLYHTEGFARIRMRAENRIMTWLKKDEIADQEIFCTQGPSRSEEQELALFYSTALEFVTSLEAKHNLETLNLVVEDIRKGASFEESLQERLGGTCRELYTRWKSSF